MKKAKELVDKLKEKGLPDMIIDGELKKANITLKEGLKVSGYAMGEIEFTVPNIIFDEETYERVKNIAKEYNLNVKTALPKGISSNPILFPFYVELGTGSYIPYGISLRIYRLSLTSLFDEVASLYNDKLFIKPDYEKADELLEKIVSEVYRIK